LFSGIISNIFEIIPKKLILHILSLISRPNPWGGISRSLPRPIHGWDAGGTKR